MSRCRCFKCGEISERDLFQIHCPYCGANMIVAEAKFWVKVAIGIMIFIVMAKLGCFKSSSANGAVRQENYNQIQEQTQSNTR